MSIEHKGIPSKEQHNEPRQNHSKNNNRAAQDVALQRRHWREELFRRIEEEDYQERVRRQNMTRPGYSVIRGDDGRLYSVPEDTEETLESTTNRMEQLKLASSSIRPEQSPLKQQRQPQKQNIPVTAVVHHQQQSPLIPTQRLVHVIPAEPHDFVK